MQEKKGVLLYKGKPLGGSQKVQLQMALNCGRHFKQCNISSITKEADLLCPFSCCTASENLKATGKQPPGPNEMVFACLMEYVGMLAGFRFQPKVLKGWRGGVDFYHPATRLVVQIDDPHHFREHHIHDQSRGEILERDMHVNLMCWEQDLPLLRLTKADLQDRALVYSLVGEVQQYISSHKSMDTGMKLVVLSRVYSSVKMGELDCSGHGQEEYLAACAMKLKVAGVVKSGCHNSVWFTLTK